VAKGRKVKRSDEPATRPAVEARNEPRKCKDHAGTPAVARCSSCNRAMCGTCLRFSINERPACVRCAYEASTRPQRRLSLAVVFPSFAAGAGFWLVRRYDLWPDQAASLAFAAVVVLLIAGLVGSTARSARGKEVRYREEEEEPQYVEDPMQGAGNPYRAGARRVLLAVSPRVSGKLTALVVLASLVGASILVPASVRLPRWIEAEMVLGLWWLVMAVTLVVLLYRGFRLNDDLVVFMPWDRPQASKRGGATTEKSSMSLDGCGGLTGDGCSGLDGEGAVVALVVGLVLVVALGAAWVMVEVAMPLVFLLMYSLLMRAIRRAARDRRGCAGDIGKSLASGLFWATLYILPLAGLAYAAHLTRL
jgi:hypothetical protein